MSSNVPEKATPHFCFARKAATQEQLSAPVTKGRRSDLIVVGELAWKPNPGKVPNEIARRFRGTALMIRCGAAGAEAVRSAPGRTGGTTIPAEMTNWSAAEMIDTLVHAVSVDGGWLEIDTAWDFHLAREMFRNGASDLLPRIER